MSHPDLVSRGHYARKQLFSRNRIVAWSHGRRFAQGRALVAAKRGGALLDYGCGDGTFIALTHDVFEASVGADVDREQIRECAERLGALRGVSFVETRALDDPAHRARYDAVTCFEVLEHCPVDVQGRVLDDLARVAKPDARIVISVPIEVGLSLPVKQLVRAVASARGCREYDARERYTIADMLRMVLPGARAIPREEVRSATPDGEVLRFHGHKGFNWRALQREIAQRFRIEWRMYSPIPVTGAWLNSQVWFVCRKR